MSQDNKKTQKEEKKTEKTMVLISGKPPLYVDTRLEDAAILEATSRLREQAYLIRGVVMGLLLGIIGNMFVSHYYAAFSSTVTDFIGEGGLLTVNIVLAFVYFAMILFLTWLLYISVTTLEDVSSRLRTYVRKKEKKE